MAPKSGPPRSLAQVSERELEERIEARIVQRFETIEHYFQGPIPPPAVLAQYEQAAPGAAERIIKMAESRHDAAIEQGKHRRELEAQVVSSNVKREASGQWFGLVVTGMALAAACFCAYIGQPVVAGVITYQV